VTVIDRDIDANIDIDAENDAVMTTTMPMTTSYACSSRLITSSSLDVGAMPWAIIGQWNALMQLVIAFVGCGWCNDSDEGMGIQWGRGSTVASRASMTDSHRSLSLCPSHVLQLFPPDA